MTDRHLDEGIIQAFIDGERDKWRPVIETAKIAMQ